MKNEQFLLIIVNYERLLKPVCIDIKNENDAFVRESNVQSINERADREQIETTAETKIWTDTY